MPPFPLLLIDLAFLTQTRYMKDKLKEMAENAGTIPISARYRCLGNLNTNCAKTNLSGWASADNRAIFSPQFREPSDSISKTSSSGGSEVDQVVYIRKGPLSSFV